MDVIECIEVGDAREAENRPDDECHLGVTLAEHPQRQRLGWLAGRGFGLQLGVLLFPPALLERLIAPCGKHERDRHREQADDDVLERTDRYPSFRPSRTTIGLPTKSNPCHGAITLTR